jgi:hypothetical protein
LKKRPEESCKTIFVELLLNQNRMKKKEMINAKYEKGK